MQRLAVAADEEADVLSFPKNSFGNPLTPEGLKAWVAWVRNPNRNLESGGDASSDRATMRLQLSLFHINIVLTGWNST